MEDIVNLGEKLKKKFPQFKFYYDEDSLAYIVDECEINHFVTKFVFVSEWKIFLGIHNLVILHDFEYFGFTID